MYRDTVRLSFSGSDLRQAARGKKKKDSTLYLIIVWTLLYKGLMLKCTQDKLLKMFIIAVVIINYTHE